MISIILPGCVIRVDILTNGIRCKFSINELQEELFVVPSLWRFAVSTTSPIKIQVAMQLKEDIVLGLSRHKCKSLVPVFDAELLNT